MKMPTWITLEVVLDEFLSNAHDIAKCLGLVLNMDHKNDKNADQIFCIGITIGTTYNISIMVKNLVIENVK